MWVLRFFLFISKGVLLLTAMTTILWLTAVVILSCVLFQRLSGKVGVPALLFFILLGMFFGTDGVVKIPFDNFELAQNVCSVALLLTPFRAPLRQQLLVSWSGLRGAASIVFAIMATMHLAVMQNDVFHIVFFIVLFSVLLQGTCLPRVAAKLGMTDDGADVMKTFTDYVDEVPVQFIRFSLPEGHPWAGQAVRQVVLPPASILVLVLRGDRRIVPDGSVQLQAGDTLILSGTAAGAVEGVHLYEKTLDADSSWLDQPLCRIHTGDRLVILVRRGGQILIPDGDTVLRLGDRLVINDPQSKS